MSKNTARRIAEWMAECLFEGEILDHSEVINWIYDEDESLVVEEHSSLRVDERVLTIFRCITGGRARWNHRRRCWRLVSEEDFEVQEDRRREAREE